MPEQSLVAVITPGHSYRLFNYESDQGEQVVNFIQKAPVAPGSTEMEVVQAGTTNEAVIAMLIDRLTFLNAQMHSAYNDEAITALNQALYALGKRTMERIDRDVEGTHQA